MLHALHRAQGAGISHKMEEGLVSDGWEDLIGSAMRKKILADGDGPAPDLGTLVRFNWRGRTLQPDGTTGFTFAERTNATARIGDGDEIPGDHSYYVKFVEL